ncbi:MAG TPA: translocation/assembly module TamB domain-containing protein [Thermodesulfobacteriota bacterium]
MRRVLVVASVLLVLLALAVVLVARSAWVETRLRQAVLAAVEDALEADVTVDEAHIRFLPPSVELVGVRAASRARPDLPPVLAARRLRVSLDPVLLLAGRVDLDQVRLEEPEVTLVVDGSDVLNLPAPRPRRDDEPRPGGGLQVVVGTVAVDGGRVRLEFPREGPLTIDIALERLVLRPDLPGRAADFGLVVRGMELVRRNFRQPLERAEAEGRVSSAGVEIRRFRGELRGLVASARGLIGPFPDPELRLTGTVTGPLDAVARTYIDPYTSSPFPLSGRARATFTSAGPAKDAVFETSLTADAVRLASVSADRVTLAARVSYDDTRITRGAITVSGATVEVTGQVIYDDPIPFDARLVTRGIAAAVLARAVGAPVPPEPFGSAVVTGEVAASGAAAEARPPGDGPADDDRTWRVGADLALEAAEPAAAGAGAAATAARALLPVRVAGRVDVDERAVRLGGLTMRGLAPGTGGGAALPDVTLDGEVALDAPHTLALRAAARVADLGALGPFLGARAADYPLAGAASVRGTVTGPLASPAFAGDLTATRLRAGRYGPVDLTGPVTLSAERLASTGLAVRLGATRGSVSGRLDLAAPGGDGAAAGPGLAVDIGADPLVVEELLGAAGLDLPLAGRGRLTARFEGPLGALSGQASVALRSVHAYGQPLDRLEATVSLGPGGAVEVSRVVAVQGTGRLAAHAARGADGALSGNLTLERLPVGAIEAVAARGVPLTGTVAAQATLAGTWSAPRLTGRVGLAGAAYEGVPLGDSGVDVTLSWPDLAVRGTVIQREVGIVANVSLEGARPFVVALDLNNPNLAPYLARVAPGRTVRASARGLVRAAGRLGDLEATRAELRLGALRIDIGDFYLQNVGDVAVVYGQGRLDVVSATFQGPTSQAVFGGHVDVNARTLDLRVNGGLELAIVRLFTDQIARASGTARIVAQAVGSFGAPRIFGAAEIENGSVTVRGVDPPVTVEDLAGVVAFDANRVVLEGLTMNVGGGPASASGWIQLDGASPAAYNLQATFDNVTLGVPRWLPSTSRGTIRLSGSPTDPLISGEVEVQRASYNRRIDVDLQALYRAIRAALEPRRATRPDAVGSGPRINVRVVAPDNVRVETGLFDAELRATLEVAGRLPEPNLLGSVEVISGTITFRGTVFTVRSGRADFIDPFRINPSFDLVAETTIREYEIRMRLSGTVEKYRVEFTSPSHPGLTDLDILSLITVGVVAAEARDRVVGASAIPSTGGDVSAAQAIAVLSGATRGIEREAARYIGVDTFQIDTGPARAGGNTEPRLTVGKRYGDIVVSYSHGIGSEQEQTVQVEYRLSTNLALVAQWNTVDSFGGGVKFRFQFR